MRQSEPLRVFLSLLKQTTVSLTIPADVFLGAIWQVEFRNRHGESASHRFGSSEVSHMPTAAACTTLGRTYINSTNHSTQHLSQTVTSCRLARFPTRQR